jgi:Zn-dependent peptidase ImmA (M78 family)/transcriptional regulator with XRE-family HTH domain
VNHAVITPELLRWARERRGLSYAEIAHSLHVSIDVVRAWELGESYPPFGKAQNLAKLLRVPFGYFFLSQPPQDAAPIPDFRTIGDRAPSKLSPDFVDVCNQVLRKQEWYREYCEQSSAPALDFVNRFRIGTGIDRVAEEIRGSLSIDAELRSGCRDWSAYLTRLSHNAQDSGILVMRSGIVGSDTTRTLDVEEFRGFAIADPFAPVVFINSRDATAAQIFTLLHEISHIWIGQSGISNPDPTELSAQKFEEFCNEVAAEVLVPKDDFEVAWSTTPPGDAFLLGIARVFWVSTLVVLRRAYEFDKIGRDEFFRLVKKEKDKQFLRKKGKGGNSLTNMLARNSQRLTTGVLTALRENQLLYRDAAKLLGVQAPALPRLLRESVG